MGKAYDESEALQAVAAALLYGRLGIGRAAHEAEGTTLRLDMGHTCKVSKGARDLLARAQELVDERGVALGMYDDLPLTARDLTRAVPDRRTPQERTRDEIYRRGNRWQIDNYEATHS